MYSPSFDECPERVQRRSISVYARIVRAGAYCCDVPVVTSQLSGMDPGEVEATVGSRSFTRGLDYAQNNRVLAIEWDASTGTLTGSVVGQGALYDTAAFFTSIDDGALAFDDGECTCPVGYNCKHVAAIVIAAADGREVGRTRGRPRSQLRVVRPSSPSPPRTATVVGAAAARADRRAGAAGGGLPAGDRAGIARERRRGQCHAAADGEADARGRSRRLGQRLAELERAGLVAGPERRVPRRSPGAGPRAVRRASRARGTTLLLQLRRRQGARSRRLRQRAAVVAAGGGGAARPEAHPRASRRSARCAPRAGRAADRRHAARTIVGRSCARSCGSTARTRRVWSRCCSWVPAGTVWCAPSAALTGPAVAPSMASAVVWAPGPSAGGWRSCVSPYRRRRRCSGWSCASERLQIPADELERFAEELCPALRHVATVVSSDGSFAPPEISAPTLVLRASYGGEHAVEVGWEWAYEVGATHAAHAVCGQRGRPRVSRPRRRARDPRGRGPLRERAWSGSACSTERGGPATRRCVR